MAAKPNNGKTVGAVQAVNASGVSAPVQYLVRSTASYMVFTFTMREDADLIAVKFAAMKLNMANTWRS